MARSAGRDARRSAPKTGARTADSAPRLGTARRNPCTTLAPGAGRNACGLSRSSTVAGRNQARRTGRIVRRRRMPDYRMCRTGQRPAARPIAPVRPRAVLRCMARRTYGPRPAGAGRNAGTARRPIARDSVSRSRRARSSDGLPRGARRRACPRPCSWRTGYACLTRSRSALPRSSFFSRSNRASSSSLRPSSTARLCSASSSSISSVSRRKVSSMVARSFSRL